MPDRMLFLNLPVRNVAASMRFFEHLGFGFDPAFTDQSAACLVISGHALVMLVQRDRFAEFAGRPIADARTATGLLVCVSAAERGEVDELVEAAMQAGARPAAEPIDAGFMYGRGFYDLDGHHWECTWMSPDAVEQGPVDPAASATERGSAAR